ncbi:MAG TPA: hypothetical protein VJB59_03010 [Bdellovibrionota bacterium]|nr:hypothetical protein [Bdellovibrionota bacterium]
MDNFGLLGSVALKLHNEFRSLYYVLLPIFFAVSLVFAWFKNPQGGPDFVESIKRTFVATLLLAGFAEITDIILFITNGLAARIDDMTGLDTIMKMAGGKAKSYTLSASSVVLAFNDLLIAALAFLSYIVLYVARYIMVAIYHFSWVFLSIIAPILLLFHLFSPKLTLNLFRSMIEVASWKVVWAVLSAMLAALPFGNAYNADGNYLTVVVLNFVIALCMHGTPLVVHALVGSGLSGMTGALAPTVAGTMLAVPAKAATMMKIGRDVLGNTRGFATGHAGNMASLTGRAMIDSVNRLVQHPTSDRYPPNQNDLNQATPIHPK